MSEIIRPSKYYDVKGTLLTATFEEINRVAGGASAISSTNLNAVLYGSAIYKYAMGSTLASNGMVLTHGLSTGLYCYVSPQTGGVLVGGHVSGTSLTFYIQANIGIFFTETSATVNWLVIGNA